MKYRVIIEDRKRYAIVVETESAYEAGKQGLGAWHQDYATTPYDEVTRR